MAESAIQAVRLHDYGTAEQLKLERIPRPVPQEGEVLVRVHAAGVNPVDWKTASGMFKNFFPLQFPYIPGRDLAGIVEEVGPGVSAFQKGQAVFGQSTRGTYTEYTTSVVDLLALKPEALSFSEAAAIPVGATTAWQGLFDQGKLESGQRVLIQGASGGVGSFAVQFARWKGAHVIATTSSKNVDFVRSLGAETVIDYTSTPVAQVVQDVDLVFDTVGGSTLASSLQAVRSGGRLVGIAGLPSQEDAQARGIELLSFSARVSSSILEVFARLVSEKRIKVVVGSEFPLRDVQQALVQSQSGHGLGRIVLQIAGK